MRVDPNYIINLTASVDQSASEEAMLASELSSGLRVASLQDGPVAVAQSTLLGSSIAKDDSFVQTASNESSRLQVTDSTLGEVVTQITSALSTAVGGNNGTLNASDLASVAQTLSGIRDQVLSLANTSYQGQYLFGGSQGSAPPFTLDTSTTPATATYNGDSSVQYVETPSGQKIQVNLPGSAVFGAAGSGVLGAQPVDLRFLERRNDGFAYCRYRRVDHRPGAAVVPAQHTRQCFEPAAGDEHLRADGGEPIEGGTEQSGVGGPGCGSHTTVAGRDTASGIAECD